MKSKMYFMFLILLFGLSNLHAEEWFRLYEDGIEALKAGKYDEAVTKFQQALDKKDTDINRIKTYGMHFIEYYPNRELGVALYYLGRKSEAVKYLKISQEMEPSQRAQEFLSKLGGVIQENPESEVATKQEMTKENMIVGKKTIKLVGERMSVAVLPFENKGASQDLGEIILDKMITALFSQERFRVIERTQLDKILQEQQLALSGVLDASTAAALGKGLGVDAIIMGSVAATRSGSLSIDARAIDTESATIIVAHDAYSGSADALSVKNTVENLAHKFTESLPLVSGTIIQVNTDNTILLDVGRTGGLKKGLKCVIYKEGPELRHPISGEILGRKTIILGEVLISESLEKFATAQIIRLESGQTISIGDKFLTK
jgi:TolB-like protein